MGEIANVIGMLGKIVGPLTALGGMYSQMSMAAKEKKLADQAIFYSKHPEAVRALVKANTEPLSAALTTGTGNIVNASLAEQGLSQAPGIQSQVLAQALAPYMQAEQQMGLQQALAQIGLPLQALEALRGIASPSSLAQALKNILPGGTQTGGGGYPELPPGISDVGYNVPDVSSPTIWDTTTTTPPIFGQDTGITYG